MDLRGFPKSLPEFQKVFPDDSACQKYLESLRWSNGFVCPTCGVAGEPYRFPTRSSVVLRCRACKKNTSLTAGTVMQSTHTPLSVWFWGAYLVTTQTPGQSALQFQRQLGLSRYETAFQILHKLRSGMVRPDRERIGGEYAVEMDECFVGGRTRGEGRGNHNKATVIGAVEVRLKKPTDDKAKSQHQHHKGGVPIKKRVYAGRLRLSLIEDRSTKNITTFATNNLAPNSTVRTDGWKCYDELLDLGFNHEPVKLRGDREKADAHLPMIHLVFSNLKTWINGTHHGRIERHHLQAYLNEFVFRFNRRFYPMTSFNSVLGLAARSIPPTYESLYSGKWVHPKG
jgi:predicted RNA-binding Zn-ribbon protein involved in translation (DUF1610 family)